MENKQKIRTQMKEKRDAISEEIRREKEKIITYRLINSGWFAKAENILVYAAIKSEVRLWDFVQKAWKNNKRLFFPKVSGRQMDFFCIHSEEELAEGAFSVLEPDTDQYRLELFHAGTFSPEASVMLVPGVAFSEDGYRIGYGGGYYDRYLAAHRDLYTAGIAYAEQFVPRIPAEEHDIQLNEIISDKEVLKLKN